MNKKANSLSLETIVIAIIVLIALFLIAFFVIRYGNLLGTGIKDNTNSSLSMLGNLTPP